MSERPWNEGDPAKPYSVTLWTDTPGETDTCNTGEDFATEKEARLAMADMDAHFPHGWDVPYILLDGPGVHEVTCRTAALKRVQREREADERMARNENAMQCGMAFGVAGYNDAMGYDSEPYDPAIHDTDDYMGDED
jgi:hypothetical protein